MTQEEIDKLVEMTDTVALVSNYVTLEKQGKNYKGLCPFHSEKTSSFVVSPEKKLAKCFGCGKGGGILQFLQEIENVDFRGALKILADFNGVEFKDAYVKENLNTQYFKIMETSNKFYTKYLFNTKKGLDARFYLNNRGLDDEIIEKFSVGLSPEPGDTMYKVLAELGYNELDMFDVGLVDKGDSGKYHDIFSNRIMFPIKDESGNVLAYSARIFDTDNPNQPKYINSRETKIFNKSEVLFNLNLAKPNINKRGRVILHEGQMDVIASYRSNLGEAVCSLGTALNDRHVKRLAKYTNSVIICYDGDKAGRNASVKAIKLFQRNNFNVHLVLLPNGMDPDEYVLKFGSTKYEEYFESHIMDTSQYMFEILFIDKNLKDKTVVDNLKREAFSLILSFKSQIERETYLAKLSSNLNASLDAVKADFEAYRSMNAAPIDVPQNPYDNEYLYPAEQTIEPVQLNKPKTFKSLGEIRIFGYARRNKNQALYIDKMISDDLDGLSVENQALWNKLIYTYYLRFETFNDAFFVNMLSDEEMAQYMIVIEELRHDQTKYDDNDLSKCIQKIKDQKLDAVNEKLANHAKMAFSEEEQSKLIDQMFKNKRKKASNKKSQEV